MEWLVDGTRIVASSTDGKNSDGDLMLVCCERDVDDGEFLRVLEKRPEYRNSKSA